MMSSDAIGAIKAIEATGMELMISARATQVTDSKSYQTGAAVLRNVKQYLGKVAEVLDPIIRAAHATHRIAVEQKKKLEAPALRAELILKGRMEAWDRAERDRLQAEQARRAAEAREETRLAALVMADARGDEEAVTTIASGGDASVVVFSPPVQEPQKAKGISYRVTYSAKIVNLMTLVQAVASDQAPLAVVKANEVVLNQMARTFKDALHLPGVELIAVRSIMIRS